MTLIGKPAVRTQADNEQDYYSDLAGIETGDESDVRQEFKDESDINTILRKYGVDTMTKVMDWGTETDYNMDLQQAFAAVDAAKNANFNVPEELKGKYPDYLTLLNAVESGQYQADLQKLADSKHRAKLDADEKAEFDKELAQIKRRHQAEKRAKRDLEDRTPPEPTP